MSIEKNITDLFRNTSPMSILGYGKEGQSTYRTIRKYLPDQIIHICDLDPSVARHENPNTYWFLGKDYLDGLYGSGLIIKSPGIPFHILESEKITASMTSQTDLFTRIFSKQIIGITGTKGKSTTSSLLHHIFEQAGKPSLLAGNIGIPPFDLISDIREGTHIVFEMSSHQLENLQVSPHTAIFLNIYQEHLDHYPSFAHYQQAKLNIMRWQNEQDIFLYDASSQSLRSVVEHAGVPSQPIQLNRKIKDAACAYYEGEDLILQFKGNQSTLEGIKNKSRLMGAHNMLNVAAAASAALLMGLTPDAITAAVESFEGLPHRLEWAGLYKGIRFYNDSISTIPESTIAAIKSLPETAAIVLGGFDRGVDYKLLLDFLGQSSIRTFVCTGKAGQRMLTMARHNKAFNNKVVVFKEQFDDAVKEAADACRSGDVCLLSPAAASYDAFKDFKERGERFKEKVKTLYNPNLKR